MKRKQDFDEVMIVNPCDLRSNNQQPITLMRFHQVPDMGYYAEPPELGYYGEVPQAYGYYSEPPDAGNFAEPPELGWYAQAPDAYTGYAQAPELGYYAEYPEIGYYAAPVNGYPGYQGYAAYSQPAEMAYYAEPPEVAEYSEPVEYYAEEYPGQAAGYAQMPEMVGYNEYEPLSEDYPGVADYGEPDMAGYVREGPPPYNPGCPMPTNVAGFGESVPLEGYVKPGTVNASCDQFIPQPGPTAAVPDTFRPLW